MPTIVLTPRHTEDSQALWRAASELGWKVERLSSWRDYTDPPKHLIGASDLVLYVDVLFAQEFAKLLGKTLHEVPEDWLVALPSQYRQRLISLTTLGEARKWPVPLFVKPPNDKSFAAGVYKGSELPVEFDENMSVLISQIVKWEVEFRCFVLDRQLMAYSVYSRNGQLQKDNGFYHSQEESVSLEQFMSVLLSDSEVLLGRTAVIDVGTIDGKWAVVEQNAAWGSGIYGCDPYEVLKVLEHC